MLANYILLEALEENLCPCLFQLVEAAHVLWLVTLATVLQLLLSSISLSGPEPPASPL